VNLFIASELSWEDKNITVRQETDFPQSETTTLIVKTSGPAEFDLRIRVPYWAINGVMLKINNEPQQVTSQPSSYLSIRRTWKDGDKIEMTMPMSLWLCPMPDDADLTAIMYGPMVLAGQLAALDVPKGMVYTTENWFVFPKEQISEAPVIVTDQRDPTSWIEPVDPDKSGLTFRTKGVGKPNDVTLVPYHRLWNHKYAIYWRLKDQAGWKKIKPEFDAELKAKQDAMAQEAARKADIKARTIDSVDIGLPGSEKSHKMNEHNSRQGEVYGRHWRDAAPEGWFEYNMEVLPDKPTRLLCTYWGNDSRRSFDILVDGEKIATQKLNRNRPDEFFDVEYDIPAELTTGKKSIVVRFDGIEDSVTGGVYGCATLKSEP
jgi:hypothetical protein